MSNSKVPFVEVTWLDAWGDGTLEVYIKDAVEKNKPLPMRTRGWLLCDNDDGVLLASEISGVDSYRSISFVPRGMMTGQREIKEARTRRLRSKAGASETSSPLPVTVEPKRHTHLTEFPSDQPTE